MYQAIKKGCIVTTRPLIAKLSALAARGAIVRGQQHEGREYKSFDCEHPGEGSA
jgi:hypothetical protein